MLDGVLFIFGCPLLYFNLISTFWMWRNWIAWPINSKFVYQSALTLTTSWKRKPNLKWCLLNARSRLSSRRGLNLGWTFERTSLVLFSSNMYLVLVPFKELLILVHVEKQEPICPHIHFPGASCPNLMLQYGFRWSLAVLGAKCFCASLSFLSGSAALRPDAAFLCAPTGKGNFHSPLLKMESSIF